MTDAEPRRRNERVRREVSLPAEAVAPFVALVHARRSATVAMLAYGWVLEAAKLADQNRGGELPRKSTVPRGGAKARVKWTQSPEEYARCVQLVGDAGSSLEAVLLERIGQYMQAGGDPLSMPGPPERAARVAA